MIKMEQPKKKNKRIIIYCEPCAFKTIIEKEDTVNDFVEIKTSPIPGGVPELDPKTGKTKIKSNTKQNKKYKCPKCGRGVVAKELQGAYVTAIKQIEAKNEAQKIEADRKQRLQDGTPIERTNLENT